jgi:hypothetical protein
MILRTGTCSPTCRPRAVLCARHPSSNDVANISHSGGPFNLKKILSRQVVYPEVGQNFWVGNEKLGYFMRHIASGDEDAKVLAEDASPLLEMLMKKLDDAEVGGEESLLILQVIAKLYRRFGGVSQHQFRSLGPGFAILGRIARESVELAATSGVKGGGGGVMSMRLCATALRLAMECSPDNVTMAVRHLVPEVVSCGLRLAVSALLELECVASKGGVDASPVKQIGILGGSWGGDGVIKVNMHKIFVQSPQPSHKTPNPQPCPQNSKPQP